jgi:predicted nucleotidyltransferase
MRRDVVDTVIARFAAACRADERVLAAYVCGSYAAGDADAFSDLDLGLITSDESHDNFVADRAAFIHQLGEPLFLESFNLPDVAFVILADGTEIELMMARAGKPPLLRGEPYRVLLDKAQIIAGAFHSEITEDQSEALRRRVYWFWHDLSHFMAAMGRGQLWWAQGQLDELRRYCIVLLRLQHDFMPEPEAYWKVDKALPQEQLSPLAETFCPLEWAALLHAGQVVVRFFCDLAPTLAQQHGIAYPTALETIMLERLAALGPHLQDR